MTSYSDLPSEVQLEISQHLDVASLKSLRLVEKASLPSASKRLFKEVELWPLIWSWNRLEAMSASPFISDYVEILKFNTNVLTTAFKEDVKDLKEQSSRKPTSVVRSIFNPSQNLRSAASVSPSGCQTTERLDADDYAIERFYEKYEAYIQAQEHFVALETAAIQDVIRGFPNLRAIVCEQDKPTSQCQATSTLYTSVDNPTIFDRGKDFLGGPCLAGFSLGTHDTSCLAPFLDVCMSSKVYRLKLRGACWYNLPTSGDEGRTHSLSGVPSYRQVTDNFEGLRLLDLYLDIRGYLTSTRMHVTYCKRLTDCVARYINLETLNLNFGVFQWSYARDLLPISASLAKLRLPRLRHLTMSNVLTKEKSMIELLESNSTTLRVLELADIGVGLPQSIDDRESVISLFWNISRVTALETVKLRGLFTNLIDEAWIATSKSNQAEIKDYPYCTQLEDYMCHKTEWPVGGSLEEYLISRETGQDEVQDFEAWKTVGKRILWEDSSWECSWAFLRRCRMVMLARLGYTDPRGRRRDPAGLNRR